MRLRSFVYQYIDIDIMIIIYRNGSFSCEKIVIFKVIVLLKNYNNAALCYI